MKYNIFKKSGITVSEVSFGCMSLTAKTRDNDTIINKAIDNGITLFDTADLYEKGKNEIMLGNAVKLKRKDVIISTKAGNRWRDDGSGWEWFPSKKHILEAAEKSLQRLQTDYIDIYLLHGGTLDDPREDILDAFEILLKQGKIRSYGISSVRPNVIRQYAGNSNISTVMTQYSVLDRRPEEETLQLLLQHEIGVMARGTVASGLLIDKPAKEYINIPANHIKEIQNAIYNNIENDRSRQEAAIKYVMAHRAITTAVAGIRTIEQLQDALKADESPALSKNEIEKLKNSWKGTYYTEHR